MSRVHPSLSRDTLANSKKTGERPHPKRQGTLSELSIFRVLRSLVTLVFACFLRHPGRTLILHGFLLVLHVLQLLSCHVRRFCRFLLPVDALPDGAPWANCCFAWRGDEKVPSKIPTGLPQIPTRSIPRSPQGTLGELLYLYGADHHSHPQITTSRHKSPQAPTDHPQAPTDHPQAPTDPHMWVLVGTCGGI